LDNYQNRINNQPADRHYTLRVLTRHLGMRWFEMSGSLFEWEGLPATLTQLPNRRLLTDQLHSAMATQKRNGRRGALLFMDLDNFKPLNDLHGHSVGDLLLTEVARRLTRCVREIDTVARFGGDEFVVLLSHLHEDEATSRTDAFAIAEKIQAAMYAAKQAGRNRIQFGA
jgi:GGDEF domain-containing protein